MEKYVCACTGVVGKPPEWAVVSEVSGDGPDEGGCPVGWVHLVLGMMRRGPVRRRGPSNAA